MTECNDFSRIVDAYRDRYGVDLSHMRMRWSKHPVYNNGKRSYDFADDETGGSWVNDGTVRINPNMGSVLKRFGIEGMTQAEFRRRLIAHELAHEVWHHQSRKAKVKKLIKDVLAKARKENFTTPYLDTYSADTPKSKFDSELFAEYISDQLNKKAQAVDKEKWPGFQEYQRKHHDDIVRAVRKIVRDDYMRRGNWGLKLDSGKLVGGKEVISDNDIVEKAVIRAGKDARRARRANCHELAASILDKLIEKGVVARRLLVDKDQYNGIPMGHSTVMFQGEDGRWHRAAGGMANGKKSQLGDFDSLEDAIDQYIAVEKANKQTTDDERVDVYDTTDLPFNDMMPWPEYKAMARTGKRLYHQEKKAERLYTYLPEDNTADVDGILSTALTENGWEKYRGRTHRKTREAVLRILDAIEPDWRRSMSVSALAEPIPDDAAEDLKEFAKSNRLYSFDVDDLVKAKILKHLRETNKGKGTHEAKSVSKGSPDWKRKPGKLLFQGIPHYMVEIEGGRIHPELIRSEKDASSKKETYEAGEGTVESYTPDKTEDHDEIIIRLKNGRHIRISNNTKLGKILKAAPGARIGYHGWKVD